MDDFSTSRRQRFISEQYFKWLTTFLTGSLERWKHQLPANGTEEERRAGAAWSRASNRFRLLLLLYTGGDDIEPMRAELELVVAAHEEYTTLERIAHENPNYPPFMFGEIGDYEQAMQLISLCHLLHRRDLLPRIATMLDPYYRAQDTLYEDLLAYAIDGRFDVDKWFHDNPYRNLINSFYRDTDEESIADITLYLDKWYPSMENAPGHDGHLNMTETGGSYVGYWAMEAAAAVYLLKLDDSSFRDHIVYPKDLVTFAREQSELATPRKVVEETGPRTVRTGQVCPETGIWKALDRNVPGVLVQQGDVMPEVFAHDERGVFRPLPAVWEFERKV